MTETIHALQQHIDELQSRLAYQEDVLQSLDQVIARQDLHISQLQQQFQQLQQRLEDMRHTQPTNPTEKPPHY